MSDTRREIVVGADGSPAVAEALRWALAEARLRGSKLRVVHAWRLPLYAAAPEPVLPGMPAPTELDEQFVEAMEREARGTLDAAVHFLQEEAGGTLDIDVTGELIRGQPAVELVSAADGAELLVVGSRGLGGFKGLLLGSVSQQCAHHATCPVVIVPAPSARP